MSQKLSWSLLGSLTLGLLSAMPARSEESTLKQFQSWESEGLIQYVESPSDDDGTPPHKKKHGPKALVRFPWRADEVKSDDAPEIECGSPPLLTEDPSTPDRHGWEINLTTALSGNRISTEYETVADLNYGFRKNIQLKFEIPYRFTREEGMTDARGVGQPEIGVKYRFIDANHIQVSVYPQMDLQGGSVSSSEDELTGRHETRYLLPLGASYQARHFKVIAEAGRSFSRSQSKWEGGVGAAVPLNQSFTAMAEMHAEEFKKNQTGWVQMNLAGRLRLDKKRRNFMVMSLGHSVVNPPGEVPKSSVMVGLQLIR